MIQADCENEEWASTQFLQIQKIQVKEMQEHLEQTCNVLPVFGFNSARKDLNLIKSYLLPILVNERDVEPTVVMQANQLTSFKLGDFQLLNILKFLPGATSFDSFLKARKTS